MAPPFFLMRHLRVVECVPVALCRDTVPLATPRFSCPNAGELARPRRKLVGGGSPLAAIAGAAGSGVVGLGAEPGGWRD